MSTEVSMARTGEILTFWFGTETGEEPIPSDFKKRWWKKDPAFDEEIAERFGDLLERGARGELDAWQQQPLSALALVLLLDQFSRNIFRGSPRAFAQDPKALSVAQSLIAKGEDAQVPLAMRAFVYMPLMHSEDLAQQKECVRLFHQLDKAAGEGSDNLSFAKRHLEIIERFGRFPHRNEVLGRESTPEELAFLKQPGSSF